MNKLYYASGLNIGGGLAILNFFFKEPDSKNFFLHYGDLSDPLSINKLIEIIKPDEIYNLAAQSHVAVSFDQPDYTANINALGSLRILETIKNLNLIKKTKYYQAGTSEMFGETPPPQNENTYFRR